MRGGLQEQGHPLPGQAAEAAHPRRRGGAQPVTHQQLQDPVPLQVELGPVELLWGLDTGGDEAGAAAAAGPHGYGGQARWEAEAKGPFRVEPVQGALRAVEGDLLHTALLLWQTTVGRTQREDGSYLKVRVIFNFQTKPQFISPITSLFYKLKLMETSGEPQHLKKKEGAAYWQLWTQQFNLQS